MKFWGPITSSNKAVLKRRCACVRDKKRSLDVVGVSSVEAISCPVHLDDLTYFLTKTSRRTFGAMLKEPSQLEGDGIV